MILNSIKILKIKIIIENNFILKEEELIKKLEFSIYNKNIIFLDNNEIEQTINEKWLYREFLYKKKIS